MAAEPTVTANADIPDATRAHTAYLTALEHITLQMTAKLQLEDVLATITQGLVQEFHAAFARLWLLGPGDLCTACYQTADCANRARCLHLKASAGLYTNLNGTFRRVPLGVAKIGHIALGWGPTYTNDTLADDRLPDKTWLREHGLVSFAGYPLLFQEELLGVLAMFSQRVMHQDEFDRLAVFANQAAIAIKNAHLFAEVEALTNRLQAENVYLAASITHEVNQPLGAMVNSANACVRWLAAENLARAQQSAVRVVAEGQRAADIIDRIRALIKKEPPRTDGVELNEAILEVMALTHGEVVKHGVAVQTHLAEGLPRIHGDRVQLQQVLLNLILNAVEALSGVSAGARELRIGTGPDAAGGVLVTVQDSGPGLPPESVDRLFDAFYTTKLGGMGMGLSICRSIVEAHGGQIWAARAAGPGATVQFTLPGGVRVST
jgi:signal transduction histidine kinase